MTVMVEHPVEEAEALLKRTAPDGQYSMTAEECRAAERARARLAQAVAVERGPGGSDAPDVEAVARSLVGQRVRVQTTHGSVKTGTLRRLAGFRTAIIEDGPFNHPVNLSLVRSIEAEKVAV